MEKSGQHKRLRRPWRQEARREAVLGARRPVGRPSWAPGGPSAGRLGRQEARIVGFADSSSEIVGFAQSAGRAQAVLDLQNCAKLPRRKPELDNFCID